MSGKLCENNADIWKSFYSRLRDFLLSSSRYYLNNYADSFRQDEYDLFLGNHRGANDEQLSPAEYSRLYQSMQRRQSNYNLDPEYSKSRLSTRYAAIVTVYLQLTMRYFAPKRLNSIWTRLSALFWLGLLFVWRLLFGTRINWRGLRQPKSGYRCWDGDDEVWDSE